MNSSKTSGFVKKKIIFSQQIHNFKKQLAPYHLHTVCQEARCPNISECFSSGTATFLVMGDVCTRHCRFCSVKSGQPSALDYSEISRLVEVIRKIRLSYVVITSVTRDDLPDGGSAFLAELAAAVHENCGIPVELLFPDFQGRHSDFDKLLNAPIAVYNHNIEMVRSLFPMIRPQGDYQRSLELLEYFSKKNVLTKTGFMIGLGETKSEIYQLIDEAAQTGVKILTIGQYIQPTKNNAPVAKYYSAEEFDELKDYALSSGISYAESGSFVRSSYKAKELYEEIISLPQISNG